MNTSKLVAAILIGFGLITGAHAQADKSRAEVVAEAQAATQAGQISTDETGRTLAEQFPQRYPAAIAVSGKSRAEVEAEVLQLIREYGSIDKANEDPAFPNAYRYGDLAE